MKYLFKLALVVTLFFTTGWVYGQSNQVDYMLESETVATSGMEVTILSTIHKEGNTLTWKQEANNNIDTTHFQINDTTGNWNHGTSKGLITYSISIEDYQGFFVLEGTATNLTASLSLTKEGTEQQLYIFKSNSISYL